MVSNRLFLEYYNTQHPRQKRDVTERVKEATDLQYQPPKHIHQFDTLHDLMAKIVAVCKDSPQPPVTYATLTKQIGEVEALIKDPDNVD